MSPTGPSVPTSTPSYSCWAIVIVFLALKPSLRPASCCRVEVMNGGAGLRRRSPRVTERTTKWAPSSDAMSARVASPFGSDTFSPPTSLSVATNSGGSLAASRAWSDQYSTGTRRARDRKSTRLNSSHDQISYAVFCLKKKKNYYYQLSCSSLCFRLLLWYSVLCRILSHSCTCSDFCFHRLLYCSSGPTSTFL